MTILFWGMTASVIGKVLLGAAVAMVHWRVVKEHRIDKKVLTEMRRERNFAVLGIFLVIVGYFLELMHFNILPF